MSVSANTAYFVADPMVQIEDVTITHQSATDFSNPMLRELAVTSSMDIRFRSALFANYLIDHLNGDMVDVCWNGDIYHTRPLLVDYGEVSSGGFALYAGKIESVTFEYQRPEKPKAKEPRDLSRKLDLGF